MSEETDPRSEEQTDAVSGEATTPDEPGSNEPDDDGTTVEPVKGDQGEYVEQTPGDASSASAGFDPDRPVATSPPPAEAQSGVPATQENEGIQGQPEFAKGTDPAASPIHTEANETDNPGQGDEARAEHQPSATAQGRKVG